MAVDTANYLHGRGYEIVLLGPAGPLDRELPASMHRARATPVVAVSWEESAPRWIRSLLRVIADVPRVMLIIHRAQISLLITNTSTTPAPLIAARAMGVPALLYVRERPHSRMGAIMMRMQSHLASSIVIVAPEASALFSRALHKCETIRDGVALDRLRFSPHSRPAATTRLLLLGRLDERKGQDLAITAVARLRAQSVMVELSLVGEAATEFGDAARALVRRLGLETQVSFLGPTEHAAELLSAHDVLIIPSRAEWTPLALMEAMALGVPVIAASVGNIPELLAQGAAGRLMLGPTAAELVTAVLELLRSPASTDSMIREARAQVERMGSLERSHIALERLIDQHLASGTWRG